MVLAWFIVAPHLARIGLWPAILLVSIVVIPGTLLLVLIALPLWDAALALPRGRSCSRSSRSSARSPTGASPANFAKLWAAVFAGWAFLRLFEKLSWVVLVAFVIPLVDIISVYRGPTHTITAAPLRGVHGGRDRVPRPGGGAAYLGPPDVLFYALFLAAAARWDLRVGWTWFATTFMYALTVIIATATDVGGLPALPFLSFGFLVANGDLLWRAMRPSADSSESSPASS